jgi:hypothetical protein
MNIGLICKAIEDREDILDSQGNAIEESSDAKN